MTSPFPFSFGSPPTSGRVGGGSCLSLRGFDEHPAAAAEVAFRKSTQPGRLEAEGVTNERSLPIEVMMGRRDRGEEERNESKLSPLPPRLFVPATTTAAAASAGTSKKTKSSKTRAARPPPPPLLRRRERESMAFSSTLDAIVWVSTIILTQTRRNLTEEKMLFFSFLQKVG